MSGLAYESVAFPDVGPYLQQTNCRRVCADWRNAG